MKQFYRLPSDENCANFHVYRGCDIIVRYLPRMDIIWPRVDSSVVGVNVMVPNWIPGAYIRTCVSSGQRTVTT